FRLVILSGILVGLHVAMLLVARLALFLWGSVFSRSLLFGRRLLGISFAGLFLRLGHVTWLFFFTICTRLLVCLIPVGRLSWIGLARRLIGVLLLTVSGVRLSVTLLLVRLILFSLFLWIPGLLLIWLTLLLAGSRLVGRFLLLTLVLSFVWFW